MTSLDLPLPWDLPSPARSKVTGHFKIMFQPTGRGVWNRGQAIPGACMYYFCCHSIGQNLVSVTLPSCKEGWEMQSLSGQPCAQNLREFLCQKEEGGNGYQGRVKSPYRIQKRRHRFHVNTFIINFGRQEIFVRAMKRHV